MADSESEVVESLFCNAYAQPETPSIIVAVESDIGVLRRALQNSLSELMVLHLGAKTHTGAPKDFDEAEP